MDVSFQLVSLLSVVRVGERPCSNFLASIVVVSAGVQRFASCLPFGILWIALALWACGECFDVKPEQLQLVQNFQHGQLQTSSTQCSMYPLEASRDIRRNGSLALAQPDLPVI